MSNKTENRIMNYQELKAKHAKAINDFPIRFAFSDSQLAKVVEELGPKETLMSIGGGGILRKTDKIAFDQLFIDCEKEMETANKDDDFLINAIEYELGNHEYCITNDPTDTFESLGLDSDCPRVRRLYAIARKSYLEGCEV